MKENIFEEIKHIDVQGKEYWLARELMKVLNYYMNDEKKIKKIYKLKEKYKIHENLIIARVARKTIRYIDKNTENFPNKYIMLKNKIIESIIE